MAGALLGGAGTTSPRPGKRGRLTMAQWDYSAARLRTLSLLLFQLAVWTTLQFWQLRAAVTIVLSFLESVLHSMLPPIAVAAIVHAFEEYCVGGGRGGTWGGARTLWPRRRRMSLPSTWQWGCGWDVTINMLLGGACGKARGEGGGHAFATVDVVGQRQGGGCGNR